MSILQINKKAVTEEDAADLVMLSWHMDRPLDVPVSIIDTTYLQNVNQNDQCTALRNEINFGVQKLSAKGYFNHIPEEDRDSPYFDLNENPFFQNALQSGDVISSSQTLRGVKKEFADHADAFSDNPDSYIDPYYAVILLSHENMTIEKRLNTFIGDQHKNISPLPGTASQWNFHHTWHEIGHSTGAAEPQTEMIATVISRQAFADQTFLYTLADERAVRAIYDSDKGREKYGWPMVDAIDHVIAAPQKQIDAMSKDDIKALRFRQFDHDQEAVKLVGQKIAEQNVIAFMDKDLSALRDITSEFKNNNVFEGRAKYINDRFNLACERLTNGYQEASNDQLPEEEKFHTVTNPVFDLS